MLVMKMKKMINKCFGSPYFFEELIFAGKYLSLLQLFVSLLFCGYSRFGGLMGSLAYAEVFLEAGLTTLTVTLCGGIVMAFLRKSGKS